MLYSILEQNTSLFGNLKSTDISLKNLFETEEYDNDDNFFKSKEAEENPQLKLIMSKKNSQVSKHKCLNKIEVEEKIFNFDNNILIKEDKNSFPNDSFVSNPSSSDSDYNENIYSYNIEPSLVKEHFSFLFTNTKQRSAFNFKKSSKILDLINNLKLKDKVQ